MFYGSHATNMDAKGRIAIPARVRELLQESANGQVVSDSSYGESLSALVPENQWQEICQR